MNHLCHKYHHYRNIKWSTSSSMAHWSCMRKTPPQFFFPNLKRINLPLHSMDHISPPAPYGRTRSSIAHHPDSCSLLQIMFDHLTSVISEDISENILDNVSDNVYPSYFCCLIQDNVSPLTFSPQSRQTLSLKITFF